MKFLLRKRKKKKKKKKKNGDIKFFPGFFYY